MESRWLIRRDMHYVVAISNQCWDDPWTLDQFNEALRQRNVIGKVVEIDDKIVAYCIYELNKKVLDVINMGVDADHRRQGVGRFILDDLKKKLSIQRRDRLVVDLPERKLDAQLFLKANGFICTQINKDQFTDEFDTQDGYTFLYDIRIPLDDRLPENPIHQEVE